MERNRKGDLGKRRKEMGSVYKRWDGMGWEENGQKERIGVDIEERVKKKMLGNEG